MFDSLISSTKARTIVIKDVSPSDKKDSGEKDNEPN